MRAYDADDSITMNSPCDEASKARSLIAEGDALSAQGLQDKALACYDDAVRALAGSQVSDRLLWVALGKQGAALVDVDRFDEANRVFDTLCARVCEAPDASSMLSRVGDNVTVTFHRRAVALLEERRYDPVIAAVDALRSRSTEAVASGRVDLLVRAGLLRVEAMCNVGRSPDAITELEALVAQYGDVRDRRARTALVRAADMLADLLEAGGEPERALNSYDDLIVRFARASEPELRASVAVVMGHKATALRVRGRYTQALATENEILERFDGASQLPGSVVVDALAAKGWTLELLQQTSEAMAVYERLVERYGTETDAHIREQLFRSRARIAALLVDTHRYEAAIVVADEALACVPEESDVSMRVDVAGALVSKALARARLRQWDQLLAEIGDDVVEGLGGATPPSDDKLGHVLSEKQAMLSSMRARAFAESGQLEQSIATWTRLAERHGEANSPTLQAWVDRALNERAELLVVMGHSDEAIVVADSLIERETGLSPHHGQLALAEALSAKGAALMSAERYEEAIEVLDDVAARFGDSSESELRAQVALALHNKVMALRNLGREAEACGAYDDLLVRFGDDAVTKFEEIANRYAEAAEPHAREMRAQSLYSRASLLRDLARRDEGIRVLTALVADFEGDENLAIQALVAQAREEYEELA